MRFLRPLSQFGGLLLNFIEELLILGGSLSGLLRHDFLLQARGALLHNHRADLLELGIR